jgi:hypothetical protein
VADDAERLAMTTRTAIRVVVRGMPLPEGAQFNVGDLRVLIVTRARAGEWPESVIEKGDLDGVVWVKPEQAFAAAARLQDDDHIVAVRLDLTG